MDWKFNNVVDCDHCKYDCNSTEHCPYTAGWADGQTKMIAYLNQANDLRDLEKLLQEIK